MSCGVTSRLVARKAWVSSSPVGHAPGASGSAPKNIVSPRRYSRTGRNALRTRPAHDMSTYRLDNLFNPSSITLVGASPRETSPGRTVLQICVAPGSRPDRLGQSQIPRDRGRPAFRRWRPHPRTTRPPRHRRLLPAPGGRREAGATASRRRSSTADRHGAGSLREASETAPEHGCGPSARTVSACWRPRRSSTRVSPPEIPRRAISPRLSVGRHQRA